MIRLPRLLRFLRSGLRLASIPTDLDSAISIRDRKSIWMVEYLRARRSRDTLKGFYRQKHLQHAKAS